MRGVHEMHDVYWRAFVEASPDFVLVVDATGTILEINTVVSNMGPVVGRKIWQFGTGDAQTRIKEKLAAVVETRKAVVYSTPGIRRDGTLGWYEVRLIPVAMHERVERVLWTSSDITERVNAAESLEASERRARAMVEHGTDCISLVSADGTITYASPGLLAALGFGAEELIGMYGLDLVHPEDRAVAAAAGRASAPGSSNETTVRLRHKDGSYRWFDGTSQNLLHDPAVRAVINNQRDVTLRRRLEEQLRHSQKMEAIGLLAGGVAHDFNNLLGIIVGFAGLAARNLPSDHPVRQHLHEVEQAGRRGGELTRKLLAFSRKQIMQTQSLDVRSAVEDFSRLIERIVGEDVEIALERAPDALVVRADPMQLEQVLMNLCANARQAMPVGGHLRISTREAHFDASSLVARPWARAGAFAEIAVSDTGVGMDEATMARVFEPFFTTKPEGTGLGLAMVYGIVEQHGGFMHVESTLGQGTTFRAYLPRTSDGMPASNGPRSGRERAARGNEALLVAEDEPSLRAFIAATLTELGYRVTATRDGDEAVRTFERDGGAFALVILDVVMPRLGAREAYERMRALRPEVKVLFTTGYAPASTRLWEVLGSGAAPLLEKPFTSEALGQAVRDAIEGTRRRA
jgi:PAS domain S-box-containing protein